MDESITMNGQTAIRDRLHQNDGTNWKVTKLKKSKIDQKEILKRF
jgi:hypothetical protein